MAILNGKYEHKCKPNQIIAIMVKLGWKQRVNYIKYAPTYNVAT